SNCIKSNSKAIQQLVRLPTLEHLTIKDYSSNSKGGLLALTFLTQLKKLELTYAMKVRNKEIRALTCLRQLGFLGLRVCNQTGKKIRYLGCLSSLRRLDLVNCVIDQEDAQHLGRLTNLCALGLYFCQQNETIQYLVYL